MKKFLSVFVIVLLAFFCACEAEKPIVDDAGGIPLDGPEYEAGKEESYPAEKVVVTIGGKDYEVFVPEKTRISDGGDGYVEISTSSLAEEYATIDLLGLSECEYIQNIVVKLNGESEKLILPKLSNLTYCEISGNNPSLIDASGIEGCKTLSLSELFSDEIKIGKGPENLILGYGFDIEKIGSAENVKSITVHGNADLSKIADIGEVENVYIFGENDNVAGLKNLKSLKRLSFQAFTGDLSGIKKLSMETLVFGSDVKEETLGTLSASETVTVLMLNDEFITNSDFMDKLPNLKELYLTVDPIQPPEVPIRDEITDVSQIELLETNLPKEKLKEFFQKGGKIFIMDDWSRT